MTEKQIRKSITKIKEEFQGLNCAAECLTAEIREAKRKKDDKAYKLYWDKRERLFKLAKELSEIQVKNYGALFRADLPITRD